ncbi:MAG: glycosyltransferase family 9 protein [Deltaproteobacteria bacterium]|nr:glycosyltransferase family 9 protein [Deltaproteobacteria bacterium]
MTSAGKKTPSPAPGPMAILVVQPMKLGDLVQSTPLLSELRKASQGVALLATRPEVAKAAAMTGLVDQVTVVSESEFAGGKLAAGTRRELGGLTDNLDLLVNLSSSAPSLAFCQSLKARERWGPRLENGRLFLPPAQRLAAAIMSVNRSLGRLNLVDLWRLLTPAGAQASRSLCWPVGKVALAGMPQADFFLPKDGPGASPLVGLHLGSGHRLRRWPVERFVALAQSLAQSEARLILMGGPGERSLARRFLALWGDQAPRPLDLSGQTTLDLLGPVIGELDLLVSADTGVAHVAAAVGTRILSIFGGPALAGETAPYSLSVVAIQGRSNCSPCAESPQCPGSPCLALPEAGQVTAAAQGLLWPGAFGPAQPGSRAQAYVTFQDSLGQAIRPMAPTWLDDQERLALAVREAAAASLVAGHAPGLGRQNLADCAIAPNSLPADKLRPTVDSIAALAFGQPQLSKAFSEAAMEALALISRQAARP